MIMRLLCGLDTRHSLRVLASMAAIPHLFEHARPLPLDTSYGHLYLSLSYRKDIPLSMECGLSFSVEITQLVDNHLKCTTGSYTRQDTAQHAILHQEKGSFSHNPFLWYF